MEKSSEENNPVENVSEEIVQNLQIIGSSDVTPFELAYKHYNRLWSEAQNDLADLIKNEPTAEEEIEKVASRLVLVRRASVLYLQYVKAANKLVKCYEHIPHPQKRLLLRKTSEACIGRVLELKHELVRLENSEFQFLDQTLLALRMLPKDMDIKIPEYFLEDVAGENKKTVSQRLSAVSDKVDPKYVVSEKKKYVKTAMVYLRLIQAHERARQVREYFRECQKKFYVKEIQKRKDAMKDNKSKLLKPQAAAIIQRAWRKHHSLQSLRIGYESEMKFLGMIPRTDENAEDFIEKDRLAVIKRNEEEYAKAKSALKEDYLACKVPEMMEELEDRIRSYFQAYMELFGNYPAFPDEEEGGSTKMFETKVTVDEEQKEGEDKEEAPKEAPVGKDAKKNGDGKDKKEEESFSLKLSSFVPDLLTFQKEYENEWKDRESKNFDRFDPDLVEQDVMKELNLEVQKVVDDKMRLGLQRLVEAFEKDAKKKAKPKKGKKGKDKGKKGKEKKEKDLTPDRSTESLIKELVDNGIIVSYPSRRLDDFVGDYNYSGYLQSISGIAENDPCPCLGDIRRVVNEYCILPMGSQYIHSKGEIVKSILLAGPEGMGKRLLVHAICSETNATLMDLSAENIDGKYPGDEGKDMLLHLILKVGRMVQPAVIYVRDAENYFYKKVPASCTLSDPGRLKKDLPKLLKSIGNNDRILICGTTVQPFDVDLKGLGSSYLKVLCILKPDYNCRRSLWRKTIIRQGGELTRNMDMSVLCNTSDGFTSAAILRSVDEVLNERRLELQSKIPLEAVEFLRELANHVPVYEEEVTAYMQWLDKMPTRAKRADLLNKEREEAGVEPEEEIPEED